MAPRKNAAEVRRRWIAPAVLLAVLAIGVLVVSRIPDGTVRPADVDGAGDLGVIEVAVPWLADGCGRGCWNAYLELAAGTARDRRLTGDEIDGLLAEMQARSPPAALGLSAAELRRRIADGLAIDSLLAGLGGRTLAVAAVDETRDAAGVVRRTLLFWDPEVGSFEGLLLLPAGDGPHPAVIGLHGHRDDPEVFAEEYLGSRLAGAGIAVLMPRLRAHDCSLIENYIARTLWKSGLTLMGLRVYETLLMHKYLRHLDAVDGRRIGLLGHSGGSSTANLVVRLSGSVGAHVVDYQVDYRNFCGPLDIHCETVPELVPLAAEVNDFGTLGLPHLLVPYKFPDPDLRRQIVDFFRRHLAAPPAEAAGELSSAAR